MSTVLRSVLGGGAERAGTDQGKLLELADRDGGDTPQTVHASQPDGEAMEEDAEPSAAALAGVITQVTQPGGGGGGAGGSGVVAA